LKSVEVLDFLKGYESYLRKRRISVSTRRYELSFTDFSLVYRSALAQIFPRSQPMKESNTSTRLNSSNIQRHVVHKLDVRITVHGCFSSS
jgi:hypothetical protein